MPTGPSKHRVTPEAFPSVIEDRAIRFNPHLRRKYAFKDFSYTWQNKWRTPGWLKMGAWMAFTFWAFRRGTNDEWEVRSYVSYTDMKFIEYNMYREWKAREREYQKAYRSAQITADVYESILTDEQKKGEPMTPESAVSFYKAFGMEVDESEMTQEFLDQIANEVMNDEQ
eukprot:48880_1